jgi:phosphate uptake regulator
MPMRFEIEYDIDDELIEELSVVLMLSKEETAKFIESLLKEGARRVNEYLKKLLKVIYNVPEDKKEQVINDILTLALSFGLEIGESVEVSYREGGTQ